MKTCPYCQTTNDDNAQYCSVCHNSLLNMILYSVQNSTSINQNQQGEIPDYKKQVYPPHPPFYQNPFYRNYHGQQYNTQYTPYGNPYYNNNTQSYDTQNPNFSQRNQTFYNSYNNKKGEVITVASKTKNKNKLLIMGIAFFVLLFIITGFLFLKPKIFITVSELCAQGRYEEAYEKADDEEKSIIMAENTIAYLSAKEAESFYNLDSFLLRNAWYTGGSAVLYLQGTNQLGGVTTSHSYWMFDYGDNDWNLWANISDWEEEEINKYDDTDELLKKTWNNVSRDSMKEIMIDSNMLPKSSIKNINNLFKQGLLDEVISLKAINNPFHD